MLNEKGCRNLAVAVVVQALKDYRKASAALLVAPDNRMAQAELDDIEAFFGSEWFRTLRELSDGAVSENILEEFKNDSKRILESGIPS